MFPLGAVLWALIGWLLFVMGIAFALRHLSERSGWSLAAAAGCFAAYKAIVIFGGTNY